MNKAIYVVVAIVGIAVAFYFFQTQGESPNVINIAAETNSTEGELSASAKHNSLEGVISPDALTESTTSDEEIELSSDSAAELQEALDLAVKDREAAEEAMRVIEMKLSALDSQLDDIEARGDDPADVQDETLGAFQAIFAEYQDTITVYDKAAAKEEWIEAKIEEAGL